MRRHRNAPSDHGAHGRGHHHGRWRERGLQQILFRASFAAIIASAIASFLVVHFASRLTRGPWLVPMGVLAAAGALWVVSAVLSRRLARPLRALVDTARRIGAGDLSARARLGWHGFAEVRVLADALGDMASRLEQQVSDQRALLAGASHELRTPLQHMKLLVEILRAQPAGAPSSKALVDLEREIDDVDSLVGRLLASTRLDFDTLDRRSVDAVDLARRALERVHADAALLQAPEGELRFEADPTVLVRALENLLENARDHGGGATSLSIERGDERITFTVSDRGPGLPVGEEHKVLEPFFHRVSKNGAQAATAAQAGGLGLGLHLVRRIAQAHGGDAFAHNRDGGGASVGFFVRA